MTKMKSQICLLLSILAIVANRALQVEAVEYLNFCAKLTAPNQHFEISSARLHWGKWTPSPTDHSTKVSSPLGNRFGGGQSIYLCSAGKSHSFSGTEAEVTVVQFNTDHRIVFSWNYPYRGKNQHQFQYNHQQFDIRETCFTPNLCEYTIYSRN